MKLLLPGFRGLSLNSSHHWGVNQGVEHLSLSNSLCHLAFQINKQKILVKKEKNGQVNEQVIVQAI